jgi:hypothetical protein
MLPDACAPQLIQYAPTTGNFTQRGETLAVDGPVWVWDDLFGASAHSCDCLAVCRSRYQKHELWLLEFGKAVKATKYCKGYRYRIPP